jgi:hypothetical protein
MWVGMNSLFGYFELRVDRIVGWVEDAYDSDITSMQIEVLGRWPRQLDGVEADVASIASCTATAQPDNRRFVFSLSVEDRFTGADLVREEVTVMARASNGNSGRVLLEGATQLELIREHLGAPAVVIFDLDFSSGGNARPYLGGGWSGLEADFTWTENDDSFISFDTPAEPGAYVLRMTAGSLVREPRRPVQKLMVFINATQVADIVSDQSPAQFHECKFAHEAFASELRSTLRLHHPDAVRPSDLGDSADRRRLAFYFKRMTLVRLLPPACYSAINREPPVRLRTQLNPTFDK